MNKEQEARNIFRALADPITAELKKQGINDLQAGLLAATFVQAQLEYLANQNYGVKFYTKDKEENNG